MSQFKQLQEKFPPDTVLFKEGDNTREMYILLAGEVVVTINDQEITKISENGAFLGEMATLLNATRSATIKTTKKCVCLKILPDDIDTLFKVTPELGFKLSKTLAQRLADVTAKLAEASSGGGDAAEPTPGAAVPISKDQIAESEKAIEANAEAPPAEDLQAKLTFLTRTEVHKDIMRYYFNCIGEKADVPTICDNLELPEMVTKLVLKEFKENGMVSVEDGVVEFQYDENMQALVEEWIFDNGLFRMVG